MNAASRATGPAGVSVRELRWSDFDPIRETYWLLYDERPQQPDLGITLFGTPPSLADEVEWFSQLYRKVLAGNAVVAVGELDGTYAGHCTVARVGPGPSSEAAHVGELGILVHRDRRGRGVGRAMMAHALAQSAGKFELVRLSVFSSNVRARKLYEEFGFEEVGTLPRAIRRGEVYFDEVLMVKRLVPPLANR